MGSATTPRALRVLQSFGEPGATTNPYLTQLFSAAPGIAQRSFTWPRALFGRYDVFHLHLPDVLFLRSGRVRSAIGAAAFLALLLRIRLGRIALVRTAHNLAPHERRGALTRGLDRLSARWTTLWIRLNERTEPPTAAPVETILHGDYRRWFAPYQVPPAVPGRVLFFGLIRPYKGVEDLVAAFGAIDRADASLQIVGRPSSPEVRAGIEAAVSTDGRVEAALEYVDDARLAEAVGEAALVVLPYRDMHNSGVAILALSLDRPILVPDNPTNRDLAREVGPAWVQLFAGGLTAERLAAAIDAAPDPSLDRPDLDRRDWSVIGAEHADAYARAARIRRGRREDQARPYSE